MPEIVQDPLPLLKSRGVFLAAVLPYVAMGAAGITALSKKKNDGGGPAVLRETSMLKAAQSITDRAAYAPAKAF